MSNVLMGVVAIALFIGLTIAGASFFGPEFFTARSSTQASVTIQRGAQLASAVHAYQAASGRPFPNASMPNQPALVAAGYMKAVVSKPVGVLGENYRILSADWQTITTQRAAIVGVDLGTNGEVCRAIAKAAGNPGFDPAAPGGPLPTTLKQFDCVRVSGAAAAASGFVFDVAGSYIAYIRI